MKSTLSSDVGSEKVGAAVTATQLGLTEAIFSDGVIVVYSVKINYVPRTGTIVVTITLTKDDERVYKNIVVKANDA